MNPVIMPAMGIDQAAELRELMMGRRASVQQARISGMASVSVLSGKGGVGKSNVAVNLALAAAELGRKTAILDADLGLASVDILFGIMPKFNLGHVLRGEKELSEILCEVAENVRLIPGGAGLQELADIDEQRQQWMIGRLGLLENEIDLLILDVSAGIHKNVLSFAMASDLSILVTTPEPTAIRDAYSVLKSLCQTTGGEIDAALVVNMATDEKEASIVADRIMSATQQFLNYNVEYLGAVLWDQKIRESVKNRKPVLLAHSDAVSAQCFRKMAKKLLTGHDETMQDRLMSGSFIGRLARLMSRKGL